MRRSRARVFDQLSRLLPRGELRREPEFCAGYAGDKWFAAQLPEAVALPKTTKSVSAILELAHEHRIPVTPRGAGFGYVGGCVPVRGGIALSLERMNRIKEINVADFIAIVEAGVITATLQEAVEERGLFYPPDPA